MPPKGKASRGGFQSGYGKKRASPSDDDTAPPKSKRAKSNEAEEDGEPFVPTLQKDDNGDYYVGLKSNGLRRATIQSFKDSTIITIREWYKKDDKVLPGNKGLSLTLDQYNALITALPLLESALKERGDKVVRPDYNMDIPEGAPVKDGAEVDEDEKFVVADDDEE